MASMPPVAEVKSKKPKKSKPKIRSGCLGGGGDGGGEVEVKRGGITKVYAQNKRKPATKKPEKRPPGQNP